MIRYHLRCSDGHTFDSWFQSAGAFDALRAGRMLECPHCGDRGVDKAMMAPRLHQGRATSETASEPVAGPAERGRTAKGPAMPVASGAEIEHAVRRLKSLIESQSDYVGGRFAQEARRIHAGEAPQRSIHGEAQRDEALALVKDGIPVLPLPFRSTRKSN